MLKILIKKQLMEIFRQYFYDAKKNKARLKTSTTLWFIFFGLVMIMLCGMFFSLAYVFGALIKMDLTWFYFIIMSVLAVLLGAFGSVFNTFSMLYMGKDNDLLLSLPIPEKFIIVSRLVGVYLLGTMYSVSVTLPTLVVYFIDAGFHIGALFGGIIWMLVISVIVLLLSCLLGFVVAKVSTKLKHKNFITVFIALVGFGLYYFVCFKLTTIMDNIVTNALTYGKNVKESAYGLYLFGMMPTGDIVSILIFVAISVVMVAAVWFLLSKTFISIATSTGATVRIEYKEKLAKQKGVFQALLAKEFARFFGSATYMLNCGLSVVLIPIFGIVILIKANDVQELISEIVGTNTDVIALGIIISLCWLASMNDIVAPSVALEGKNLWVLRSLPVSTISILRAKILLHLILTVVPLFFTSVCACVAFHLTPVENVFVIVEPILIAVLFALFGMFLGLEKKPNLNWTNEMYPIKQSMSVMLALFAGWAYIGIIVALYFAVVSFGVIPYLCIVSVVNLFFIALLEVWLHKRAVILFEKL